MPEVSTVTQSSTPLLSSFRSPFSPSPRTRKSLVSHCHRRSTRAYATTFAVRPGGCLCSCCSSRWPWVFNPVCSFSVSWSNTSCTRTPLVSSTSIQRAVWALPRWTFLVSRWRNSWFSLRWWPVKTSSPPVHRRWCAPGQRTFLARWSSSPAKVRRPTIRASIWSVYPRWPMPILRRRSPFWWWNTFTITTWTNSNGSCESTTMSTFEPTTSNVYFDPSIIVSDWFLSLLSFFFV